MRMTFDASQLKTKLIDPLGGSERRIKAAVAVALTKTAVAVRDAERAEMRDVFDRPTPYTLNSLFLQAATAHGSVSRIVSDARGAKAPVQVSGPGGAVQALVGIKDDAGGSRSALSWLQWHIKGGTRGLKAFEKLLVREGAMRSDQRSVPGVGARLDGFGNISRGQLVQILSQLRIDTTIGSTRALPRITKADNAKDARRKGNVIRRAYGRAGGQYVAFPNGRGKLKPGIYLSNARDFGARVGVGYSGRLQPVLLFVSKAEYEAERFDFGYVARSTIQRVLPAQLSGQLARSLLQASAAPGQRVTLA